MNNQQRKEAIVQMMQKHLRDAAEFEDPDVGDKESSDEYFLAKYESGE